MATAQDIITCARKYLGVTEKPNNDVIFNTRYYGHPVNGPQYPWCCCMIYEVFKECGASSLFCGGQKTALCQFALDWYRNNGRFFKTDPQVGDLVFFKFGSSSRETNHIGIVTEILVGGVKTIEGNTSTANQANGGMVMERSRNSGIVGYGRPAYDQPKPKTPTSIVVETPKEEPLKPIFENIYPQKGVDVAAWQRNVDYKALRQAGVKFGVLKIIRKDLNPDEMFETHYRGFKEAGIPIRCVYNYSYATTVEKAKIDAHRVLAILNGRNIPVALDVEADCQKNLGERLIQIINAYQGVIQGAGLKFCVYTGLSFYNTYIKPYLGMLNNTQFWIARYPSTNPMTLEENPNPLRKPSIKGIVAWQYSSKGRIPSAYNGDLDFDILYSPLVEQSRKTGKVIANSLRVRTSPSTKDNKNVVGYLKKGENVTIYATDVTTGWYQISLDGQRWVSNKYIELN